jgi:hypothetical protein
VGCPFKEGNNMTHLFYLFGIAFIIYEVMWIIDPISMTEKARTHNKLSKENKGKSWDDYSEHYELRIETRGLFSLMVTLWLVLGLFTFQWALFAVVLVFNIIIVSPLSKLTRDNIGYTIIHWFNSLKGLVFGVFIIVNKYHLHIDVSGMMLKALGNN